MGIQPALPPSKPENHSLSVLPGGKARTRRKHLVVGAIALLVVAIVAASFWPFSERNVLKELQEASGSQVKAGHFRRFYFPHPGCDLENVVVAHGQAQAAPLVTLDRLTIQGSYLGLISRRISRVTAVGTKIFVPASGRGEKFDITPPGIVIDEIIANDATLEFARQDPNAPALKFEIHEAELRNVGWKSAWRYKIKVRNPEPPGEIAMQGDLGAWSPSNLGATPLDGNYAFSQAKLDVYGGIAGTLSSSGKFQGALGHIDVSGDADVPDFTVTSGKHPVDLTVKFAAYVDAVRGDTFLKSVDADFGNTRILAQGSIAGIQGKPGKTANIHLNSDSARLEDVLRLFVPSNRPPMTGSIRLRADTEIPSGSLPFLRKVALRGWFEVQQGKFSTPKTQQGIDELSAKSRGEKPETQKGPAFGDMATNVTLQNGTANFPDMSFKVPGAAAHLRGTYNVVNEKIDLRGELHVETKISNTKSGPKAMVLRLMEPFFKKKKPGEVVPVRVSGTYEHPSYGLDLRDKKAQNVPHSRTATHAISSGAKPH